MFDRYMLVEGSLRNRTRDGEPDGFLVDVHYPHHCGIWLSIIEEIILTVDGEAIAPEAMQLVLDGVAHPVKTLTENTTDRWYFGQTGTLSVDHPQGLRRGPHEVWIKMALRVSFLSWFLTGENRKQMTIKCREAEQ